MVAHSAEFKRVSGFVGKEGVERTRGRCLSVEGR